MKGAHMGWIPNWNRQTQRILQKDHTIRRRTTTYGGWQRRDVTPAEKYLEWSFSLLLNLTSVYLFQKFIGEFPNKRVTIVCIAVYQVD